MAKYINDKRLTNEIITSMLARCGFEVITTKVDDFTGKVLEFDGIIRDENNIIVNCVNKQTAELAKAVMSYNPKLNLLNTSAYSLGDEIIMMEDFFASRFKIIDEVDELDELLFIEFYKTMRLLFGKEYEQDFDKHCDELEISSNEKESLETEKEIN